MHANMGREVYNEFHRVVWTGARLFWPVFRSGDSALWLESGRIDKMHETSQTIVEELLSDFEEVIKREPLPAIFGLGDLPDCFE
jgi:hypothetical protein